MDRATVAAQLVWEAGDWFAYANRAPIIPGHMMLAFDGPGDAQVPPGFESALNDVLALVLRWAERHKAPGCVPVFARLSIHAAQFRVHIYPMSPAEVAASAASLMTRHPRLPPGSGGGGLYFLGQHEDRVDAIAEDFGGNDTGTAMAALERDGILTVVRQMRALRHRT